MPLNKLDQFIKNTEGRILYVNPSDLDSTDSITNEGNSLAQPFKTVQRALLESARFSYLRGNNNDLTEKTTILLFPGEHVIDNRPGFAIYRDPNGIARVTPVEGGVGTPAAETLSLELDSNFDLTQENNILYKFNSVYGGVIVPRGTSIVGLDLRKTKLRPKYVPNPTDSSVDNSAIFRITGACYFWQFSLFDGDDSGLVYTDPRDFSETNRSVPRFSHHKLSCFEYCDGVNNVNINAFGELTDLDMYYSKVSNAYNNYREIEVASKFPNSTTSFAKRAPEWEIVGSFQSDPIDIVDIFSGNGTTASNRITVTTAKPHGLNFGTPIKIRGVGPSNTTTIDDSTDAYNVSTFVQDILSDTEFTYLLPTYQQNLSVTPPSTNATVTVEVDTVGGASPYVFNISLRSVWGMNGMHADGARASGFRSMVVAQFTAVSLQKDDRAFVKYNESKRSYESVPINEVSRGSKLPLGAAQINSELVYHLDQDAIYRPGWESSHIKISNDSFIQIVSVFAIGFTYHFDANSGADASITNSNSNFGQIALKSDGYKNEAFDKDDHAYVTSIVTPQHVDETIEDEIEWLSLDTQAIDDLTEPNSNKLYLSGFNIKTSLPISLTQGYRIGAKNNDILYIRQTVRDTDGSATTVTASANIYMTGTTNDTNRNQKEYFVTNINNNVEFTIGNHNLLPGEKIIIQSKKGDLPENITEHTVYYAITNSIDTDLNAQQIKIASSYTYAFLNEPIRSFGGDPNSDLIITSRVSDKDAGDPGSPIQFDETKGQWYINVNTNNGIWNLIKNTGIDPNDELKFSESTDLAFIRRVADERGLDDKVYKLRVVIPKESRNTKNPEIGFIIQESSTTGAISNGDIVPNLKSSLQLISTNPNIDDTRYRRNQKFIANCSTTSNIVTVTTESPHRLKVNDLVIIRGVKDSLRAEQGQFNFGYNGSFRVTEIVNSLQFKHSTIDIAGVNHNPGVFKNDTNIRTLNELPRLERNDINSNLYIYRVDVISDFIQNEKDGVYHLYVLNANNAPANTFTNYKFTQLPVDLYPQLDRDNVDSNPKSAKTYAKRAPVGDVVTNDLKKSITRETIDIFCKDFKKGLEISSVAGTSTAPLITFKEDHNLSGVVDGTLGGTLSGRTNGTYYNVKLYDDNNKSTWKGATAKVVVESGSISSYEIMNKGSGYSTGNVLYFDNDKIDGSVNATLTLTEITSYVGSVVQITGDGLTNDGYYRITSINSRNQITVAKGATDPNIETAQYAFIIEPAVSISGSTYTTEDIVVDGETTITTEILTFTTLESHGLNVGNKFRVTSSDNTNLGDFTVSAIPSVTEIECFTTTDISGDISKNGYILKHGLTSNDGISDFRSEGYGSRTTPFYDGELFKLTSDLTTGTTVNFTCLTGGSAEKRLKLGDYIQIDDEIMRIRSTPSSNSVSVFRGALGTRQASHVSESIAKKVSVIPIEFRRPSIIRASGHTFEYLGYGPGNYSTALPQVQVKTLSEREDFLVQAQERSAGAVIYTGMNSKGDTFAGNTKTSSSSGETISYDIPKPTITGQDPSKLSVSFDEVTVLERILVEGGTSGQVLSQFDGPVTMTRTLRVKKKTTLNGQLRVTLRGKAVDSNTGSIVSKGGIASGDDSFFGAKLSIIGETKTSTGIVPDEDLGAYIGRPGIAYSDAYIGNIQVGAANSNTINTRSGGLTIDATHGNFVQSASSGVAVTAYSGNITHTASLGITQTAQNGNLTQTASSAINQTAQNGNLTQTASSAINQTAENGKVTIVASANDVEVNAGTGKSISLKKSTYITGDLEVRGPESVPPGANSGTIRANYLEIPNITPVGGIVIWSGNESQLPELTVNGSVVTMWAVCKGQTLNTYTYRQLHSIISNKFGGDAYNQGTTDQPGADKTFKLPDLRNKFIIGSSSDSGSDVEEEEEGEEGSIVKRSGGDKDSILVKHSHTIAQDGIHKHDVQETDAGGHFHGVQFVADGGAHDHTATTTQDGSHTHAVQDNGHVHGGLINDSGKGHDGPGTQNDADYNRDTLSKQAGIGIESNGSHFHNVQFATPADGTHTHQASTDQEENHNHQIGIDDNGSHNHQASQEGVNGTNKNLPPYYALYYIMRIL